MGRIRTRQERIEAERERVAQVARVLHEATPAEASAVTISLHVAEVGEQLPRVPIIGLEAGAIRGTIPHRSRVERWAR
jgi:hypothetical protein